MLKLTKKADYGLIALKHLAVNSGGVSSSAKAIADCYGIPLPLLAKILQKLTKIGLLQSLPGTNGGYKLARSANQITALEDRKSTRLNSSHVKISYAVFCLKKKNYLGST